MSLEKRILTQVMLRACKYRVNSNSDYNTVSVAIPLNLTKHLFSKQDLAELKAIVMEELTISKKCAQAYLDLHARVTEMAEEIKKIHEISRDMDRVPVHEMLRAVGSISGLSWGLYETLRGFLEDKQIAERKDYAV